MNNIKEQNISRRETLAKVGLLGAGAAAFLLASKTSSAQPAAAKADDKPMMTATDAPAPKMMAETGDLDIVKFALGLERLEAAYYAQVVMAQGTRAYLPVRSLELMQKIALAKNAHVSALEGVLTGAGQTLPDAMNYQFPAQVFQSPITFAWFGYTLEEIGIGAYLGAVGSIESADIRNAAASIYGAKAQHAALLRTLAGFEFAPRYYESPLTVDQVNGLLAPYMSA